MVIADPNAELVNLVRSMGDPAPAQAAPAARQQALLIRRRFGLSLPTPFVGPPAEGDPIRVAAAVDGAAISAVKWRVFGSSYRGLLPDSFLDNRDIVPPTSFWTGRALVPPSRRHRLFVWGRPGSVHGYLDCGPAHPDDAAADAAFNRMSGRPEPAFGNGGSDVEETAVDEVAVHEGPGDVVTDVGEVWELYVDPAARGHGGGSRLLRAAEEWLDGAGLSDQVLSVLGSNDSAQRFYRSQGWEPTGRTVPVDLGVVAFEEHRYRRAR